MGAKLRAGTIESKMAQAYICTGAQALAVALGAVSLSVDGMETTIASELVAATSVFALCQSCGGP